MRKFFAVMLIVVFALCMMSAGVAAFDDLQPIADPSTLNEWNGWFGSSVQDSRNSGGVWTDKSVFSAADGKVSIDGQTVNINKDNFLVALSAISNNKVVKGHTYSPTDTVLVLDVSNSMRVEDVEAMIASVNDAINKLQNLNVHNRVGVILYSDGRSVLLPLDRYTDTNVRNGETASYLSGKNLRRDYRNNGWILSGEIVVNNDIVGAVNKNVAGRSVAVGGGTYIQAGLDYAFDYLNSADTAIPEDDEFQAGVRRTPIIVLMSDGEPTYGTTKYADVGNSNLGSGSASSEYVVFATQLTFSYVKETLGEKYGKEPLIYTLGLNVGSSELAMNVLDPATEEHSVRALDNIWTDFLSDGTYSWGQGMNRNSITKVADHNVTEDSRYYVSEYFEAENTKGLIAAFESIVETIIFQSNYYPTKVGEDANSSGYISFVDDIGTGMEVKSVKGMILGQYFYTGETFAKLFAEGDSSDLGLDEESATELGDQFIRAVRTRLGVTKEVAQGLVADAYYDEQLYYESKTDYSNRISYYADENGNYLGFCDDDSRLDPAKTLEKADVSKAAYIFDTYGYIDPTAEAGSHERGNLLYISVAIRSELLKDAKGVYYEGLNEVLWEIPASMIPVLTREFDIEGDSLVPGADVTMKVNEASPLRLVFEVGIRDDLDAINIVDILGDNRRNADGTYDLVTNAYDLSVIGSNTLHPSEEINAVSYFQPNERNERYYYSEHSVIYTDTNGTEYIGSTKPESGEFYRRVVVFSWDEKGENVSYSYQYESIPAEVLENAEAILVVDGKAAEGSTWVIPAGTPRDMESEDQLLAIKKSENRTGTYENYIYGDSEISKNGAYLIDGTLGNNGILKGIKPATGIKISKEVSGDVENTNIPEFTFNIKASGLDGLTSVPSIRENANGVKTPGTLVIFDANGNAQVTVRADEALYLFDLPLGSYTVTEEAAKYYPLESINGEDVSSITVEVKRHELAKIHFVNGYDPTEYYTLQARYHMEEISDTPHSSSDVVTMEEGSSYAIQKSGFDATINAPASLVADGVTYAYDEEANGGNIIRGTLTKDTVVDLIYSKDEVGMEDGPDGTPDKYQIVVNYVADANGSVTPLTKEVITLVENQKYVTSVAALDVCGGGTNAVPDDGYMFAKWTLTKNNENAADTDLEANIPIYNLKNVKGGDVYTFTAYFGEIPAPGVDLEKQADKENTEVGDVVTYTITLTNTGNVPLYNLTIKDTMVYANAVSVSGNTLNGTFDNPDGLNSGNVNTFAVAELPVGDSVSFTYTYMVDAFDSGQTLVNTAVVTAEDSEEPLDSDEEQVVVDVYAPGLNYEDHYAYIIGYPDGTVRPDASITRAEVATIFFRLLDDESRNRCLANKNIFTDVNVGQWHNNAISTLYKAGVLKGYLRADGTYEFCPDAPITRAELAAIATRFDTVMQNEASEATIRFTDVDTSHWACEEIMTAAARGWVTGELMDDGTYRFRPDDAIIRCEAMQLINNVLLRSVDEAGVAAADSAGAGYYNIWSDNSDPTDWYYYVIQEATNSHDWYYSDRENAKLSTGDSKAYFENWVIVQEAPDWAAWQEALTK